MTTTVKMDVTEKDPITALQAFFRDMLEHTDIGALLVPQHLPMKSMVMPTLVTDAGHLDGLDPLAPAFAMNAARMVSRLTRKPMGAKIAAVLRPCEIRAFFELVKLKQGSTEDIILIGIDCLGAYQNKDYLRVAGDNAAEATEIFYKGILNGKGAPGEDADLAPACKACEHPVAENADIQICLYGIDIQETVLATSLSPSGDQVLKQLNLTAAQEPAGRQETIKALIARRKAYRDDMFAETVAASEDLEKLAAYFAHCINCYNCRVACPVCYCKECVFVTDVFNHDPSQYMQWAARKGWIKMPTDTLFYHLTRMAHMSTACVGCGQCSNACPNDIPVLELFRMVAHRAQQAFDYEAGKSLADAPPLSVFREDEFADVVGIAN